MNKFKIQEVITYLIGKSDPNKNVFDKILYSYRNIKEISIPSKSFHHILFNIVKF